MPVPVRSMKRLLVAAVLCMAVLGGAAVPSGAADLGAGIAPGARHGKPVRAMARDWNWRDRCAWAGHYCLYAEYGYVYHYPWDDRPVAASYRSRRSRR